MAAFGAIPDDSNDFQQNFIDEKTRNLNIKKLIWDRAFFPGLAFLLRSVNKLLLEVCWWFFWRWRFQTFLHATSSLALFVNFWEISQQIFRKLSLFTEINSVFWKILKKIRESEVVRLIFQFLWVFPWIEVSFEKFEDFPEFTWNHCTELRR